MNKRNTNYVRRHLRVYRENKKLLEVPWGVLGSRGLGKKALIALCIKDVIKNLPEEIRVYLRLRYFALEPQSLSNISMDLDVSERTLNRWDKLVMQRIFTKLKG